LLARAVHQKTEKVPLGKTVLVGGVAFPCFEAPPVVAVQALSGAKPEEALPVLADAGNRNVGIGQALPLADALEKRSVIMRLGKTENGEQGKQADEKQSSPSRVGFMILEKCSAGYAQVKSCFCKCNNSGTSYTLRQ
jgi:hypothetical protein